MKKFLLIFCLSLLISSVKADTWFGSSEKLNFMNVTFIKGNNVYSNSPFLFKMEDGKIVYCVKPFTDIGHDAPYIEYLYNDSKFELTDEHLEQIKLIAYYGYNYPGHEDKKWYGITQFLIWKTFDLDDIYFTNERYGERINIYQEEINEIETLVRNHNILPSFYDNTFNYKSNNSYIEIDNNNVLNNYVISNSNIEGFIIGNELYINTKEDGEFFIEFKRKRDLNNNYILYGLDGYQSLFYPGGIEDLTFRMDISVNTGKITINKKDSENIDRVAANLEGAKYEIIKNGETISNISTNELGVATLNNLDLGEYLVKEVEAPVGYLLDKNTYYVNLTKDNKEIYIYSYEDIIKGKIKINKYYKIDNTYTLENNSAFNLYNINDELVKEYNLSDGTLEDILEYGEYYLVQKKGLEGYKLIDNYNFSIKNENDLVINLYDDPIIGTIKINKYYGENDNYSKEYNAEFELYNSSNQLINKYILKDGTIEDKLEYGEYYLKQISGVEGYKYIDEFKIDIKEDKIYSYDLYDEKIPAKNLVVDVPNTGVKTNYKLPVLLVIIGLVLVFLSKIKTTVE